MSSLRNRNLATSLWNRFPQLFIHASRTWKAPKIIGNWSQHQAVQQVKTKRAIWSPTQRQGKRSYDDAQEDCLSLISSWTLQLSLCLGRFRRQNSSCDGSHVMSVSHRSAEDSLFSGLPHFLLYYWWAPVTLNLKTKPWDELERSLNFVKATWWPAADQKSPPNVSC